MTRALALCALCLTAAPAHAERTILVLETHMCVLVSDAGKMKAVWPSRRVGTQNATEWCSKNDIPKDVAE